MVMRVMALIGVVVLYPHREGEHGRGEVWIDVEGG